MDVLVLGGGGIVGTYLVETAPQGMRLSLGIRTRRPTVEGVRWIGHPELTNSAAILNVLTELTPSVVVNAAGMNSVDACERDPTGCRRANLETVKAIVRSVAEFGCKLIHVSSNAVYGGDSAPYDEQSPRCPVNLYGQSKRDGEDLVRERLPHRSMIVRLSPLYGWSRPWMRVNPLPWIVDELSKGAPLKLTNDVCDSPLSAETAARALWRLILSDMTGEFNLGGANTVSRYGLGQAIATVFCIRSERLRPVPLADLGGLAPRPADSSLRGRRFATIFGMQPETLAEGLGRMRQTRPLEPLIRMGQLNRPMAVCAGGSMCVSSQEPSSDTDAQRLPG